MYIPGGKIHRLYMPNAIYMISDYNYAGRVAKTARLLARKQDSSVFMYIYRYSMSNSMGDLTVYNRSGHLNIFFSFLQEFRFYISSHDQIL